MLPRGKFWFFIGLAILILGLALLLFPQASHQSSVGENDLAQPAPTDVSALSEPSTATSPPEGLDQQRRSWYFKKARGDQVAGEPPEYQELLAKYQSFGHLPTTEKQMCLTFDLGYEAGYTGQILDILQQHNLKAAFFVTGPWLQKQPALVQRMLQEGHTIGNHSLNHPDFTTLSDAEIAAELDGVAELLIAYANYTPRYFRFPEGVFSEHTLAWVRAKGYQAVFWDVALADWAALPGGPEAYYRQATQQAHPGAVILFHAVSPDLPQVLDRILTFYTEEGYQMIPLDHQ